MRTTFLWVLLICLCVATSVRAQQLPLREIEAPGWDRGGEDDLFGYALARDGVQMIVGIPGAPTISAPGAGMVEVYSPSPGGWVLAQRLLPSLNHFDEKFGISLAQAGDDLAVGSWDAGFGNGEVSGSVHMFRRALGLWQAPLRLLAPGVDGGDAFGSTVAIVGDWLAISAPGFDDASGVRGAVFLYRRDGSSWAFAQRIDGNDATRSGAFGCAMAMAGDRLYIADCLGDSASSIDTGAVYWYRLAGNGATLAGKIVVPDVERNDQYGYRITASTTHVLIAALNGNSNPENAFRVYFFGRNGDSYVLQHRQEVPSFAVSLQLSADRALLAGPVCSSATTPGRNISCVRRFDRSTMAWSEAAPYLQQPEIGYQGFGLSLAADASTIHVGNPFRDVAAGPASGSISSFAVLTPGALPEFMELPAALWRFAFNTVVDGDLMVATDSRLGTPDQFNEGAAWFLDIAGANAQLLSRIDTPEPYTYERFASDVGVVGNHVVLSAIKRIPGGTSLVLRSYLRNGSSIDFSDEFVALSLPQLQDMILQSTFQMSGDRLALWGFVNTLRGRSPRIAVLRREGTGWQLEALLQPPAQEEEIAINFTRMVMHGDRIALLRGEMRSPPAEPRAWAVFVYRRSGALWNLEATLRPAANDPPATVLHYLAIHGDELALSTGDTLHNALRSRVHVFRFDGVNWLQTQRIEEPADVTNFGRQLAIEDGVLIVESIPVNLSIANLVTPLRMYRRYVDQWIEVSKFLPRLEQEGQGRLWEFSNPQLLGGRLFAAGRREGPGVTSHTHGVMFEFETMNVLFANSFE